MKKLLIGLLALGSFSVFAQSVSTQAKSETESAQIKCRNQIDSLISSVKYYGEDMKDQVLEAHMKLVEIECSYYGQLVEKNNYNPSAE